MTPKSNAKISIERSGCTDGLPPKMPLYFLLCVTLLCSMFFADNGYCADTVRYTYDRLGRLTTIVYPDNTKITYEYDANGNRKTRDISVAVLSVDPSSLNLPYGGAATCTITNGTSPYSASSSDTSVATASVSGSTLNVTGVSAGSAMITVTDSVSDSAAISVAVRTRTVLIPDTGQIQSYTDTYGEDSDYLINPPSYTKLDTNGNPLSDSATSWAMVRDNITGLIWEVKTDDGSIHDKDDEYTRKDAKEIFIADLNNSSFGGYSDWRLPTIKELVYIVDYGKFWPALDTDYFPNSDSASWYLSSTTFVNSTSGFWAINFYNGANAFWTIDSAESVRAVRGGESTNCYLDNGDGTVTDTSTGLMWQQAIGNNMDWEDAISNCESLILAEYNDWRLPNLKELSSIAEYSNFDPAIDSKFFPNTFSSNSLSSTTCRSCAWDTYAWQIIFYNGGNTYENKSDSYYARAVRGGQARLSGHLVILAPAQSSILTVGVSTSILWEAQGIGGKASISISRQGGKEDTFEAIKESTENDGIYEWVVTGPLSANCVLKIEPVSEPDKGTTQGLFTIASIELPAAIISRAPDGQTNQRDVTLTVSGNSIISYKYKVNDDDYSNEISVADQISLTELSDGCHSVHVLGRDTTGTWQSVSSPTTVTWMVDTVSPTIIGLSNDTTPNQSKTWTWDATDSSSVTFRYAIDQNPTWTETGTYNSTNTSTKGGADGTWYIHVQAKDGAGNESAITTVSAILDNTAPTATISGTPSNQTNQTGATLTVGGIDVTHYKFKLDGGDYGSEIAVGTSIPMSSLPDGSHIVYVIGRDSAGNWQTAATTATWTVDTIAPTASISGQPSVPTNSTSATLNINGEGVTHYKYKLDDGAYGGEIAGGDPITLPGLTDGSHTVYVIGRDAAGNWQSEASPTTASWTVDTVPPIITGLSNDPTPSQSKTWTWDATDSSSVTFRHSIDQNPNWTPTGAYSSTKTATKSGVDGTWYLHVQGKDIPGNESAVVTVSAILSNTAPVVTISGVPDSPTQQTEVTLTINGPGVTHYKYKLGDGLYSNEKEVNFPISLSGLSNGTYTVYVLGRDLAGNWQIEPTIGSWTVLTALTITATAGPGGTISPTGSVTVPYSADQQFSITPEMGYEIFDVQVDSASVGSVTTYNFINVTANHTIEATFTTLSADIIYVETGGVCGGKSPCFDTIEEGIASAADGATINIAEGTYNEDIILDEPKELILLCGWNATFTSQISYTTIRSMRISDGTVKTEYLVIR